MAGGAGAGTAAGDAGADAGVAPPVWDADHWRTTWAGTDDKKKAFAERHTDLKSAVDSAYAASQRIAELSAIAKTVLPKDATPEQIAAFRKDNGIPEKPEGYLESLPKGSELADLDKEIITPYLTALQELNVSPAIAAKLLEVRQAEQDRWVDQRVQEDARVKKETEDTLRGDWGNNYRAEVNNINGLLSGAPPEVREMFFDARMPDGRGLLAVPETLRWLAQLARTVNPYVAPVGASGGLLDAAGVEGRIKELEGWMGATKDSADYKKYWNDPKAQAQYRDLLDAQNAMKRRTAA